jgi:tRNA threonylcarbamoyladenosine biosynthesis protein TsaB
MELSIDTASELASVALSAEGTLVAEFTWRCRRNHTVELLPTVEKLLAQAGASKADISAVFVCTGPGMYTGLRVGISVAKGLAYAAALPLVGVGRLELDAYPHAALPAPIIAVHKAGRGELAWAKYAGDPWRELEPPQLSRPEELATRIEERTLVVGEVDDALIATLRDVAGDRVVTLPFASVRRAGTLAALAYARLSAGGPADPAAVNPVYLRPPAIGPQRPPGS